jgi:DNA polymerase delta subunit 3
MKDVFDEDEDDEDDDGNDEILIAPTKQVDDQKAVEALKARKEREEQLRKMMDDDDDDEPMQDAPDSPIEEEVDESKAIDLARKIDPPQKVKDENLDQSTTQNGRRRGRRRVMKKRTFTDEEGYLVTKEEAEWESFSEDEPEIKKPKPSSQTFGGAGSKKKVQPKGQGNIMSFFGKK